MLVLATLLAIANLLDPRSLLAEEPQPPIKVGIIGLDTSHVILFTKILNDPAATGDLAGVKIVAAYPGGSDDLPMSRDRVAGFTQQIRALNVEIVDSIDQLLSKVDVVMLESVDGRRHLEQAEQVFRSGKPIFIDKPVAASLTDAREIYRLAEEHKVPCFSTSMLRFVPLVQEIQRGSESVGQVRGCDVFGPCATAMYHPSLYFYGIHGVELLFATMGRGCVSVAAVQTPYSEVVTGIWADGRVGTYRGIRGNDPVRFGATVFGTKGIVQVNAGGEDKAMAAQLVRFFKTRQPPVNSGETIDIFAFMDAAEESIRQGGKTVLMEEVLQKTEK